MSIYQIQPGRYLVPRRRGGTVMLNRNHASNRFALAIGSALAASILVVVASLMMAASNVPAYLT